MECGTGTVNTYFQFFFFQWRKCFSSCIVLNILNILNFPNWVFILLLNTYIHFPLRFCFLCHSQRIVYSPLIPDGDCELFQQCSVVWTGTDTVDRLVRGQMKPHIMLAETSIFREWAGQPRVTWAAPGPAHLFRNQLRCAWPTGPLPWASWPLKDPFKFHVQWTMSSPARSCISQPSSTCFYWVLTGPGGKLPGPTELYLSLRWFTPTRRSFTWPRCVLHRQVECCPARQVQLIAVWALLSFTWLNWILHRPRRIRSPSAKTDLGPAEDFLAPAENCVALQSYIYVLAEICLVQPEFNLARLTFVRPSSTQPDPAEFFLAQPNSMYMAQLGFTQPN